MGGLVIATAVKHIVIAMRSFPLERVVYGYIAMVGTRTDPMGLFLGLMLRLLHAFLSFLS